MIKLAQGSRGDAMEQSLLDCQAHLRLIMKTNPDAIIVTDEFGAIKSFSAAAEKTFGYTELEVLGKNVNILISSSSQGYEESEPQTLTSENAEGPGRVTIACRHDGSTFPIDLHIGESMPGEARLFSWFVKDLTAASRTDLRLYNLLTEFAERSRVIAMGALATSIAHELNQPITAIATYVDAIRDLLGSADEQALEDARMALQHCAAQSLRAGQIVKRSREFASRADSVRRIESLEDVITEAAALCLIEIDVQGTEVELILDPLADEVFVDRIQIQQVLVSLIHNAIDAMADSPVRRLQISSQPLGDGFVCIAVADSGSGLSPEIVEQLFLPFVTTKPDAIGLGLSICRTIVEAHGGIIKAKSSLLGGAAFEFTIRDSSGDWKTEGISLIP